MESIFLSMNSNTVLMHSIVSDSMKNYHFFGHKSNQTIYSADFILGVLSTFQIEMIPKFKHLRPIAMPEQLHNNFQNVQKTTILASKNVRSQIQFTEKVTIFNC